jgi:hypothetical protein
MSVAQDYIASTDGMTVEKWIEKGVEGNGRGLIQDPIPLLAWRRCRKPSLG